MKDNETRYTVHQRVMSLPLEVEERAAYISAWDNLSDAQYQYFSLNTRQNMRVMNNCYIHWHDTAEKMEEKYAVVK